jgi:hypothetical protein
VLHKAKAAYSFWFALVESIPKSHRYTLGGKVEHYFLEFLENIFTALYLAPEQKIKRLEVVASKLDGIKFFTQLCWENKCISEKKYVELSMMLDEIGRMVGGWKKGLEKKTPDTLGRK